jgi:uncharacterized HAD superfamily protein
MEKKKIGIDIDEVVVNFIKNYLEFHKEKYNLNFPIEKITSYKFWETGLFEDRDSAIRMIKLFQESEHFDNLDFIDGFEDAFVFLTNNFDIFFITSRPEYLKDKTNNFFNTSFLNSVFEIIFSGDFFGGGKTKSEICGELGIKIIIEDNADYALDCAENGIKVFLLDKPWNKNYEKHENIIKVDNWEEILEKLK